MRVFLIGLIGLGLPASAMAIPVFQASSTFSGEYQAGSAPPVAFPNDGGQYGVNAGRTQIGASAVLTSDGESAFFFKHDLFAGGAARAEARTELTIAITNEGAEAIALRFDSQIIPGHLALRDESSGFGTIDFGVILDGTDLYRLQQALTQLEGDPLDAEFAALNGLTRFIDRSANRLVAYDWFYTNINLELGIFAPGETKTLVYSLVTVAQTGLNLEDPFPQCPLVQVSFGDPRTRGQSGIVVDNQNGPITVPPGGFQDGGCGRPNPVTRLPIDPARFAFSIVESGSPIPEQPVPPLPINYEFRDVPAPPALALFGLGMMALAVGRRRKAV